MYRVELCLVKLVKDQRSNKSKGYAFVQYTNQDDAMSALEAMDEKVFFSPFKFPSSDHHFKKLTFTFSQYVDGRVVFVELAKPIDKRTAYPKTSGPPQESSYSGQKQAED
ncbi:putative RNA recognition motif domain, nucleotide-binding alpha-beta plait domain superfamily [Helianthus annuus]|nr:putative RNA recognition motif domain, nucleotide-binding alpha-beta plait domain superfamily [Helianthus annuus]